MLTQPLKLHRMGWQCWLTTSPTSCTISSAHLAANGESPDLHVHLEAELSPDGYKYRASSTLRHLSSQLSSYLHANILAFEPFLTPYIMPKHAKLFDLEYNLQNEMFIFQFNSRTHGSEKYANAFKTKTQKLGAKRLDNKPQHIAIPTDPDMKFVRACSDGFIIGFTGKEEAKKWLKSIIIGDECRTEQNVVVINRRLAKDDFESRLKSKSEGGVRAKNDQIWQRVEGGKRLAQTSKPKEEFEKDVRMIAAAMEAIRKRKGRERKHGS